MADQVRWRRNTAAALSTFTGAQGEIVWGTDDHRLRAHDGALAGGYMHALYADTGFVNGTNSVNGVTTFSGAGVAYSGGELVIPGFRLHDGTVTAGADLTLGSHLSLSGTTLDAVTGTTLSLGTIELGTIELDSSVFALSGATLGVPAVGTINASLTSLSVEVSANTTSIASIGTAVAALSGAIDIVGGWDASANSPVLTSGTGTNGHGYVVTTAGTTALDGVSQWNLKDIAFFSTISNAWEKLDGIASEVISVAGQTGVVTAAQIEAAIGLTPVGQATAGAGLTLSGSTLEVDFGTAAGTVPDAGTVPYLASANTFGKTQAPTIQTLTYGATISMDLTQGNDAMVTLGGSGATLATPSAGINGATGSIEIWQDATGSRTLVFGTGWKFGTQGTPVLSTTPGAMDLLSYRRNSAGNYTSTMLNNAG